MSAHKTLKINSFGEKHEQTSHRSPMYSRTLLRELYLEFATSLRIVDLSRVTVPQTQHSPANAPCLFQCWSNF